MVGSEPDRQRVFLFFSRDEFLMKLNSWLCSWLDGQLAAHLAVQLTSISFSFSGGATLPIAPSFSAERRSLFAILLKIFFENARRD